MTEAEPLVGRDDILADIDRLLRGRGRGGGRLVQLVGEAGVGKSAVLREACRRAETLGWAVTAAVATALDAAVPFTSLRTALGRLCPPGDARLESLDPSAAQSGLAPYLTAVEIVERSLDDRPLLLAIDDLHHADPDSIELVGRLVRRFSRAPLLVVCSTRSNLPEPASVLVDLQRALTADGCFDDLELPPLQRDDVAQLASGDLGRVLTEDEIDVVWRRSRGIPFFIKETLGQIDDQADRSRRQTVLARILPLDPVSRSLARLVSIARPVHVADLDVLADVIEVSHASGAEAFDRLVRSRVLVEEEGAFDFDHDLVADSLTEDLGPALHHSLHRKLADRYIARRREGRAVDSRTIAHHLDICASTLDDARLLAEAAGSIRRAAPKTAERWYRRAIDLVQPGVAERADWIAALVAVLDAVDDVRGVIDLAPTALEEVPPGLVRERVVRHVAAAHRAAGNAGRALALIESEVGWDTENVGILTQMAWALTQLGRREEALDVSDRALDLVVPDTVSEVIACVAGATVRLGMERDESARQVVGRALDRIDALDPSLQTFVLSVGAYVNAIVGRTGTAESLADRADGTRHTSRPSRHIDAHLEVARAMVHRNRGEWDQCLSLIDEHLRSAGDITVAQTEQLRILEIGILGARGSTEVWEKIAVPPRETPTFLFTAAVGLVEIAADQPGRARQACERAPNWHQSSHLLAIHAQASVELEDEEKARWALDTMEGLASSPSTALDIATTRGIVLGDLDAAREALMIVQSDECEDRLHAGRLQLLLGSLDDDPAERLREAVDIFRRLEAEPWRRRAAKQLRQRGLAVPRRRRSPGILTEPERAMADLVREGRTNAQIADELSYSPKTVSVYLSRIYSRLGISNRVELTRLLDEGALDD